MMDATYHPYIMPRNGFWRSFAAFTSASLIRPPPMTSHVFNGATNVHVGTLFSVFDVDPSQTKLASSPFGFFNKFVGRKTEAESKMDKSAVGSPRIAIVGGGIAGVTAASALVKRLDQENMSATIVLFEQDEEGGQRDVAFGDCQQPIWTAATARNANSMVPGAAMHVMSQRSTLGQIFVDTCQEILSGVIERMRSYTNIPYTSKIDDFDVKPPYFALHLLRCIGPSASWDERMSFLEFMRHFVVISMLSGEKEAHDRGSFIQQLAKSNRVLFLEAMKQNADGKDLAEKMGTNKGFMSLHRTRQSAAHAEQEGKEFNEASEMIPIEDAIELEPRIANLPMAGSLYAVHRKDDYTANSAVFVQYLVDQIKTRGIEYRCGNKGTIRGINASKYGPKSIIGKDAQVLATSPRYSRFAITTEDGSTQSFDYVLLAAGVNTPLVAKKVESDNASPAIFQSSICPTYPLRGYSLTVYTNHTEQDGNDRSEKGRSANLLNKPISVDDMYCSSVGANMARMAGFGELVGYRDKAIDVPSLAPKIMARYCKKIFPESDAAEEHALQCFRPMTPDDIPLVGQVSTFPGLFLHTGHGTLGWTLCLATAECVSQAICDDMLGRNSQKVYDLPGNVKVDRSKMSPERFL